MKKLISSAVLVLCCTLSANAQIPNGYYHIKNAVTGRYISINDTDPSNYPVSQSGDVNMAGMRTFINYDTVSVSPSCVFYIKSLGDGKYDLISQGSSIYEMANKKLAINITPAGGGKYTIWGSYSGITKYLSDGSASSKDSWMMNRLEETRYWIPIPINTTDEYIGIRPDVKTASGSYWGTIYAGFSFRLASPGMSAYYVSNAGGKGFTLEEITDDVIPFATPVVIRCNSANPADNKIEPIIGDYQFYHVNWLGGVFCALSGVAKHFNAKDYDPVTMRVLGTSSEGELAFIKAKPENLYNDFYLKGNKAYLNVNPGDADVMILNGYDNPDDPNPDDPNPDDPNPDDPNPDDPNPDDPNPDDPDGITTINSDVKTDNVFYSITGVKVSEGTIPSAGIYILKGKKVIIK